MYISPSPAPSSRSPVPQILTPGYTSNLPSNVSNASFSFGYHLAVLNLDLINGLVGSVNNTTAGRSFINNTATWINAVHQKKPPPISIFTRIYFSTTHRLERVPTSSFPKSTAGLQNVTEGSPASQLDGAFKPLNDWDPMLPKTGYCARQWNSLGGILSVSEMKSLSNLS